ncbi:MAG TPA: L-seryl-tRNA(Sec) selenium transferase [Acidimicrobiia bacterium]|nr:L-seryl-tRNA(Sec) selenium transferase [Acidimicrobiia bacterium]
MPRPPSVDALVREIHDGSLPRPLVVDTVRRLLADRGEDEEVDFVAEARHRLEILRRSAPRRVVNATGVILHTNLGRAPWSGESLAAAHEVAAGYANIELDLATGERGRRNDAAERLAVLLTGAEAALVVNNNAAAVYLTLLAVAPGGRIPVSRGELIEIGGSYRLPELMAAAGVDLVEVGTTNRTRLSDYADAEDPSLYLKVHPSNYRVVGFSAETGLADLASLAEERAVPLVFDQGSGLLDERVPWLEGPPPTWLAGEPGVVQALEEGADLVTFSGDKLLGGPQAGIVVGREDLIETMRRHPATRALRVDGSTTAALAATFAAYLAGAAHELPVWRMANLPADSVAERARRVLADSGEEGRVVEGASTLGAGSTPGAEIPTWLIELPDADAVHARLLAHDPPVLARRAAGKALIDLRTVDPVEDPSVAAALRAE